jgi:hypothetical protein
MHSRILRTRLHSHRLRILRRYTRLAPAQVRIPDNSLAVSATFPSFKFPLTQDGFRIGDAMLRDDSSRVSLHVTTMDLLTSYGTNRFCSTYIYERIMIDHDNYMAFNYRSEVGTAETST